MKTKFLLFTIALGLAATTGWSQPFPDRRPDGDAAAPNPEMKRERQHQGRAPFQQQGPAFRRQLPGGEFGGAGNRNFAPNGPGFQRRNFGGQSMMPPGGPMQRRGFGPNSFGARRGFGPGMGMQGRRGQFLRPMQRGFGFRQFSPNAGMARRGFGTPPMMRQPGMQSRGQFLPPGQNGPQGGMQRGFGPGPRNFEGAPGMQRSGPRPPLDGDLGPDANRGSAERKGKLQKRDRGNASEADRLGSPRGRNNQPQSDVRPESDR